MTDEEVVQEQLYNWAAELPRSGWYTSRFRDFERMLSTRDLPAVHTLKAKIEASWDLYYAQPLAHEERTAETVVGHRLLVEGLALWLKALELAEAWADPVLCLSIAEGGNRLLMAVQHQHLRLARLQARKV